MRPRPQAVRIRTVGGADRAQKAIKLRSADTKYAININGSAILSDNGALLLF